MACRALARISARGEGGLQPPEHYLERAMTSGRARGSRREEALTRLGLAELYHSRGERSAAVTLARSVRDEFAAMDLHWHATEAERLIAATDSV